MAFEFRLPDIGEGVVEGEVVAWKVKEGDAIQLDQPMVEVMTDKATVEIPSPKAGKVAKILVAAGAVCAVGQVMIVIEDGTGAGQDSPSHHTAPANGGAQSVPVTTIGARTAAVAAGGGGRVLATPATRRLARELEINLTMIAPTGKNGRVTSDDVKNHGKNGGDKPAARTDVAPVAIAATSRETRVPFRGVRKAIAQNMTRSKFTATHFTYVDDVDVTELVSLRRSAKDKVAERGVKLTYLPFIMKAVIRGLQKWPSINSSLDETTQEIVYKKYYHLGLATQGPQGLVVGVIQDADRKNMLDVARELQELSQAIRAGTAKREQLVGSTFTISSLGQLGGLLATPIINFPESAVMGVHKIEERPVVRDGKIVARHMMNLSISVDHRIADGYDGAMFLQEVKAHLEAPALLFMDLS